MTMTTILIIGLLILLLGGAGDIADTDDMAEAE